MTQLYPDYDRVGANVLMGIQVIVILVMLGLLIYWHVKHPDPKSVSVYYQKQLLQQNQRNDIDDDD